MRLRGFIALIAMKCLKKNKTRNGGTYLDVKLLLIQFIITLSVSDLVECFVTTRTFVVCRVDAILFRNHVNTPPFTHILPLCFGSLQSD